jgi:hypothetical protein
MASWISNAGVCWASLALLTSPAWCMGGRGYLAEAGPPPLRFQPQRIVPRFPDSNIFGGRNTPDVPTPATSAGDPLIIQPFSAKHSREPYPLALWTTLLNEWPAALAEQPQAIEKVDKLSPAGAASLLLETTPQMMIDYFKPAQSSTNSTTVLLWVPVEFIPPLSSSADSRATYQSR